MNSTLKLTVIVASLIGSLLIVEKSLSQEIAVNSLSILDDSKNIRGFLGYRDDKSLLMLFDEKKVKKIEMQADKKNSIINLLDDESRPRLHMNANQDRTWIVFLDQFQNPRLVIASDDSGSSILMLDENNNVRFRLSEINGNLAQVFYDNTGQIKITSAVTAGGVPIEGVDPSNAMIVSSFLKEFSKGMIRGYINSLIRPK